MMGIGDVVEESSLAVSSPSLQIYGAGGSSPWRTISWMRFDSNTSAEGTETSAISSGGIKGCRDETCKFIFWFCCDKMRWWVYEL